MIMTITGINWLAIKDGPKIICTIANIGLIANMSTGGSIYRLWFSWGPFDAI